MKSAAERPSARRHRLDAFLAAFDFDVCADRRFVESDRHVFGRVLFAVLLVAEPDVHAELFEHVLQHGAVGDDCFVLVAYLHRARLHGTLEGQQALARFRANAQDAPPPAEGFVLRVEQRVFLKAAAAKGSGPRRQDGGAGFIRAFESEFDLALDHQRHGRPSLEALFYHKQEDRGSRVEFSS